MGWGHRTRYGSKFYRMGLLTTRRPFFPCELRFSKFYTWKKNHKIHVTKNNGCATVCITPYFSLNLHHKTLIFNEMGTKKHRKVVYDPTLAMTQRICVRLTHHQAHELSVVCKRENVARTVLIRSLIDRFLSQYEVARGQVQADTGDE